MKKGFTLIELLVAIGIMGILVTIAMFGLRGAREAGRDAKRKTDLQSIKAALELYYTDCRQYPAGVTSGLELAGDPVSTYPDCSAGNVYMSSIPSDPQDPARTYYYATAAGRYTLCAALEEDPDPTGNPAGCGTCGETCNYEVVGP